MQDGPGNPCYTKVNPPIRSRDDVEYLWDAVADGHVDWIVTDHASAPTDFKPVSFTENN